MERMDQMAGLYQMARTDGAETAIGIDVSRSTGWNGNRRKERGDCENDELMGSTALALLPTG